MDTLNKIITEKADITLSDGNIIDIIDYYGIIEDEMDMIRYTRTIMECLNNKVLDPDTFLQLSILRYTGPKFMTLIALAIRYGAESKYVVYENVGTIHIMVYTVMELMNRPANMTVSNFEIETILCIMSLLGFSTKSRAYINDEITVAKWLYNEGFNPFEEPVDFLNNITDPEYNTRISIGVMCDIPEIAFPIGFDKTIITEYYDENGFMAVEKKLIVPQPSLMEMLLNNSSNCAMKASIPAHFSTGELAEIKMCIDGGALEIFDILIDRGFNFSYFSMNRLLVALKNANTNTIFSLIYISMIKKVISSGIMMDKFQFNLLNSCSVQYASEIEDIYKTPLWQKACSGSENVPLPKVVRELAVSLNIDGEKSKPEICADLRTLASVESRDKLAKLELERQREQLLLSQPVANRLNRTKPIFCKNAGEIDPLRYTDNTLVFYTDKHNDSWCFTAEDFSSIIADPINPITKEPLPQKVLDQMQSKLSIFKIIGVNPSLLKPYDESLKELFKKDKITNMKTQEIISSILSLASNIGILETKMRNIPYGKLVYVLDYIGLPQDYFRDLPGDYQFAVFCKALHYDFKKNPDNIIDTLNIIKY
jgi:hypothetical protein